MTGYPIFLNVTGRPCLVVGGGSVAAQKVTTLMDAGAAVTVVSPRLVDSLTALADGGAISVQHRAYRSGDLEGAFLAYAATDDDQLHGRIATDARRAGVLLNVVDRPQWCDFIVPSIARRGDLAVAVSTSGRSPAMARRIRQDIEAILGAEYEAAIALFSELRRSLAESGWSIDRRARLFDRLLEADVLGILRRGDRVELDSLLEQHTGEAISAQSLGWTG